MNDVSTAKSGLEKDFGPIELGAMLGLVIGFYRQHGVMRADLLELVGGIYDDI